MITSVDQKRINYILSSRHHCICLIYIHTTTHIVFSVVPHHNFFPPPLDQHIRRVGVCAAFVAHPICHC